MMEQHVLLTAESSLQLSRLVCGYVGMRLSLVLNLFPFFHSFSLINALNWPEETLIWLKLFRAQSAFHTLRSSDLLKGVFKGVKNRDLNPDSFVQRLLREWNRAGCRPGSLLRKKMQHTKNCKAPLGGMSEYFQPLPGMGLSGIHFLSRLCLITVTAELSSI